MKLLEEMLINEATRMIAVHENALENALLIAKNIRNETGLECDIEIKIIRPDNSAIAYNVSSRNATSNP